MARARPAEITEELNDVWRLVVGYTKQETVAPLRGIGAWARYAAIGTVLFAIGTGFGVLAILRGLQTETVLGEEQYLTVFPYVAALVWCGVVAALAIRSVRRTPWKNEGDQK